MFTSKDMTVKEQALTVSGDELLSAGSPARGKEIETGMAADNINGRLSEDVHDALDEFVSELGRSSSPGASRHSCGLALP